MFTRYYPPTSPKSHSFVLCTMCISWRHLSLLLLCLSGLLALNFPVQAQGIQHEISTGFRFIQNEYTRDQYVVNTEAFPSVTGRFESESWWGDVSYTFFLEPLDSAQLDDSPIALQKFYRRPSTLHVYGAIQPETETSYIFENPIQSYRAQTLIDDHARKAGLELEYYFRHNTGLIVFLNSVKNEEVTHFSNSLNLRGQGEHNEIRRYYGIGLSHYWRKDVNVRIRYITFDAESVAIEHTWTTENSLLVNEAGQENDTEGHIFQVSGQYIWHKRMGIQGMYQYSNSDSYSTLLSSFYENFPGMHSSYDEEMTAHAVEFLVSAYVNERTTFRLGGSRSNLSFNQNYATDQIVRNDWELLTLNAAMEYFVSRHIGLQVGYEFSAGETEVEIKHLQSEPLSSTTSQISSETHTVFVSMLVRF